MSGWFTSGAFWAGTVWGFSIGALWVWHSLVRPMAKLLGIEKD